MSGLHQSHGVTWHFRGIHYNVSILQWTEVKLMSGEPYGKHPRYNREPDLARPNGIHVPPDTMPLSSLTDEGIDDTPQMIDSLYQQRPGACEDRFGYYSPDNCPPEAKQKPRAQLVVLPDGRRAVLMPDGRMFDMQGKPIR